MQVANRNNIGSVNSFAADLRPCLRPTIIGRSKELKRILLHSRVLVAEMLLDNRRTVAHPLFIAARCVRDLQGNDDWLVGALSSQEFSPAVSSAFHCASV
jgi:hypothetical protein